ncbi:MAG: polysaccharide pyruvyl transferase family protein [Candidatus Abawacabacteria bacterium]|nr:polysaccharide pyruvyl transferase family protein [Candidatus Abawacabacteria bacterium]
MRIALLGSYGRGNIGDEAIAQSIHAQIRHLFPQSETALFSHDVTNSKALHTEFSHIFPMIATGARSFYCQWRTKVWHKSISYLKSCDYIVIGGGGILHDQEIGQKGFSPLFIWWLRTLLFSYFKRKIIIWAVGVGPIKNSLSELWLKGILKRAFLITVRDQHSSEWAQKHTQKPVTIVPDPVWGYFSAPIHHPSSTILGINIRESKRLTFDEVKRQLLQAVDQILQKKTITEIWLIPFALHQPDDRDILSQLQRTLNQAFNLPVALKVEHTPEKVFALVSSCTHFIAMRFHSYIFAISAQVPCTLLSYSKKTDEITKYSLKEYLKHQEDTKQFWLKKLSI